MRVNVTSMDISTRVLTITTLTRYSSSLCVVLLRASYRLPCCYCNDVGHFQVLHFQSTRCRSHSERRLLYVVVTNSLDSFTDQFQPSVQHYQYHKHKQFPTVNRLLTYLLTKNGVWWLMNEWSERSTTPATAPIRCWSAGLSQVRG